MKNEQSQKLLSLAKQTIPWGTQTNAKRPIPEHLPEMPAFIDRASGCRLYDVDGNEYIDFRAALGPIILGYADPDVDAAVKEQIDRGVLYSMASPAELALAQTICRLVPCAEMVRFLKTGGDACSASVRIARACTDRQEIVSIGYHGWHDWYVASVPQRRRGVPDCLIELVHSLEYGDLDGARRLMDSRGPSLAAVIVSPYDWLSTDDGGYLRHLRQLCDSHGVLLIFDEVVTGFRLAMGGAGEYFDVEPDLAVFGKALANGYPLAAVTGKRQYMSVMEDIFVTNTHGGELASIAAARATLAKLQDGKVHQHIWRLGRVLAEGIAAIFADLDIPVEVKGLPPATTVLFPQSPTDGGRFENRFIRAAYAHGLFWNSPLFIMFSHTDADIDRALQAIKAAATKARNA